MTVRRSRPTGAVKIFFVCDPLEADFTLWKNLLTKNSPGSRYQILLSTFRFIITFFKTNLIYTDQSITHTLKVKLKRKKKAHQGNHFSLTIHNYIVSFSVKKTGAHLGVVSCPFLHFHQLASARLEPHVRSAGPTTGNHKGRVNIALVISILHLDG